MYSLILHDYIEHFKESFKNMKDSGFFIYIYASFIPLISERSFSMEIFLHFISILPLAFSLLISRMYGGKLSKTLYLCPLSKEQIKDYIKKGIILRIIISITVFLLLNILTVILGYMPIWIFICKLVLMILSSICFNIYCQPNFKTSSALERTYPLKGNYETRNIFSQFSSVFGMFILSACESRESTFVYIMLGIILFSQLLLAINIYKNFYHQIINKTVFYE